MRYTQEVYNMMRGRKMSAAQNITCSVRWLDTASHAVMLLMGWLDDGMMNGKSANPAVSTTPATAAHELSNAMPGCRRSDATIAISAPAKAMNGATIIQG